MNVGCGGKAGYYFSSTCVLVGSFTLFFIDRSPQEEPIETQTHQVERDQAPLRFRELSSKTETVV